MLFGTSGLAHYYMQVIRRGITVDKYCNMNCLQTICILHQISLKNVSSSNTTEKRIIVRTLMKHGSILGMILNCENRHKKMLVV